MEPANFSKLMQQKYKKLLFPYHSNQARHNHRALVFNPRALSDTFQDKKLRDLQGH